MVVASVVIYASCAPLTQQTDRALEGRGALADAMIQGLVGETGIEASGDFLPPVPYPYYKYTY